ncbi:14610_t:CDS:2, partial [Ambispora leptoticha]
MGNLSLSKEEINHKITYVELVYDIPSPHPIVRKDGSVKLEVSGQEEEIIKFQGKGFIPRHTKSILENDGEEIPEDESTTEETKRRALTEELDNLIKFADDRPGNPLFIVKEKDLSSWLKTEQLEELAALQGTIRTSLDKLKAATEFNEDTANSFRQLYKAREKVDEFLDPNELLKDREESSETSDTSFETIRSENLRLTFLIDERFKKNDLLSPAQAYYLEKIATAGTKKEVKLSEDKIDSYWNDRVTAWLEELPRLKNELRGKINAIITTETFSEKTIKKLKEDKAETLIDLLEEKITFFATGIGFFDDFDMRRIEFTINPETFIDNGLGFLLLEEEPKKVTILYNFEGAKAEAKYNLAKEQLADKEAAQISLDIEKADRLRIEMGEIHLDYDTYGTITLGEEKAAEEGESSETEDIAEPSDPGEGGSGLPKTVPVGDNKLKAVEIITADADTVEG